MKYKQYLGEKTGHGATIVREIKKDHGTEIRILPVYINHIIITCLHVMTDHLTFIRCYLLFLGQSDDLAKPKKYKIQRRCEYCSSIVI